MVSHCIGVTIGVTIGDTSYLRQYAIDDIYTNGRHSWLLNVIYCQWRNVATWRPRLDGAPRPLKVAKLLYIIKLLRNGRK